MAQKIIIKRGDKFVEQTRKVGGGFTTKVISKQEGEAAIRAAKLTGGTAQRGTGKGKIFFKGTNIPKPIVTEVVTTTGKRKLTPTGKELQKIKQEQFFRGTRTPKPLVTSVTSQGKERLTKVGEEVLKQRRLAEADKKKTTEQLMKKFPNWKQEAIKKEWPVPIGAGRDPFAVYLMYKQAESQTRQALKGLFGQRVVINTELNNIRNNPINFNKIIIGSTRVTPRSIAEKRWLEKVKTVVDRDAKFKKAFSGTLQDVGIDIKNTDRWWTRALKGVGQAGVGFLFLGSFITSAIDKAILTGKGIFAGGEISKGVRQEAFGTAIRETPKAVGSQFDPTKPENWAGILLTVAGVKVGRGALVRVNTRLGRTFVPSVKNAGAMKTALQGRLRQVKVANKLARDGIRAKVNVAANKRLLTRLRRLEPQIKKSINVINKIVKDPKTLKLEDMNPLVQTKNLLKTIGKDTTVFHATATSFRNLFGQKFIKLKSVAEILKAVRQASRSTPRGISAITGFDKFLLQQLKRVRAIITGGKSQNAFVKALLKRKTVDFDVIVKNNLKAAQSIVRALKKEYGKFARVELITMKKFSPFVNKNIKVYTIKFDGKKIIDLVDSKDVKGLKFTVTKEGQRLATPEFLVLQKIKALKDLSAWQKVPKNLSDIKRLAAATWRSSKILNKFKDPKNLITVRPQPKGMGASRIKFGETQMFFDLAVPSGYAYQTLAKNVISPRFTTFLSKLKIPRFSKKTPTKPTKTPPTFVKSNLQKVDGNKIFKEAFIKAINNLKFVRASDRFTVLQVRTKVSAFPKSLQARIKKAARGELNSKQTDRLRRDINKFINDNPNKTFVGSRTGSRPVGEREVVKAVETKLVARRSVKPTERLVRKVGIDPETKIFFDVLELGIKKAPKINLKFFPKSTTRVPTAAIILKKLRAFKKEPFANIRRRLRKGDISKWRSVQRAIKRADKLTSPQYKDLLTVIRIMFKSKAAKGRVVKPLSKTVKRRGKPRPVLQRGRATPRAAAVQKPQKPVKKRKKPIEKPKRRKTERPLKRVKKRVSKRAVKRVATRSAIRPTSRARPRSRSRPAKRTREAPRPRPRPSLRPRPRPRPRPRKTTRPRPRIRLTPRQFTTLRNRIPVRLRKKVRTVKDKEDLVKVLRRAPPVFRPSLAAVILNITAYKIPKSITGFEIRPIIIKR